MKVITTFLSCIIIYFRNVNVVTSTSSNTCFRSICIPSGYNKNIKPPLKNETNVISVDFNFVQVLNVDENEDAITLKSSIYITWEEPRITILSNATREDVKYWGIMPKKFKDHLWLPDAYIYHVHRQGLGPLQ